MDNRSIYTNLETGRRVYLRPIRPHDSSRLREGIAQMSDTSRYFRFFSGMRQVPDSVLEKLVDVDGESHLGWVALDLGAHDLPVIGAVRVVRNPVSGAGELAIATLDAFHNTGLARILIATIVSDCRRVGIDRLYADTLAENKKARSLLRAIGGKASPSDGAYVKYTFDTAEMDALLRGMEAPRGIADVHAAFDRFAASAAVRQSATCAPAPMQVVTPFQRPV
ncbi:GNAT family N-acetyltransferase [Hyphomonas johnsonii]|uniref:GNAT family N-acetyltransferase n=1 Tax=Hyphomonas johnsonii TaxID=81031 RepID=UPI000A748169|nr:GNAT family N-acetyltransferase [Hyphomonas johnsonii]